MISAKQAARLFSTILGAFAWPMIVAGADQTADLRAKFEPGRVIYLSSSHDGTQTTENPRGTQELKVKSIVGTWDRVVSADKSGAQIISTFERMKVSYDHPMIGLLVFDSDMPALEEADGKLIILDEDGNLLLTRADPVELKIISSADLFDKVAWTAPTLVGETLYVRDLKKIVALDLGERS